MRYLSICSGIEAASVAWAPLEWEPVAFVEIEPFPCAVLAHHYPGVPNLGDMRKVKWGRYRGRVDVVVGGTPCQAFSVAGLRQSLKDERGNLTLEYVRAVHAIRPRFAVWENVPGVLSTDDNAFGCFLAALIGADEALEIEEGWPCAGMVSGPEGSAAWRVLDAQFFGLAQRRQRVFLVWCPGDGADPAEILFERPRVLGHPPARGEAGQGVAGSLAARTRGGGGLGTDFDCPGELQPVAYGGNNTGGAIDVATACNAHGGPHGRLDFESETFVTHALRADGFDASEDGTGRGTPLVPMAFSNRMGATDEVTETLRSGCHGALPMVAQAIPIQEVGKRTGASTDDPLAGIGIGNEVDPMYTLQAGAQHGVMAFDTYNQSQTGHISHTLRSDSLDGIPAVLGAPIGGSSRTYVGVRRLTPRECERLQGFPDDYTAIPYRGKGAADGPRYKALGNSMAVPVMAWIGRRIMEVANERD